MPWWVFQGYADYLAKSPHPEDRSEAYLARLAQLYQNTHLPKGHSPKQLEDCFLYKRNPWAVEGEDDPQSVFDSIALA